MEEFLGIEDNSTIMTHTERDTLPIVSVEMYDEKDYDIEKDLSEIQNEALDAHDLLREKMTSGTDPKYLARLGEVDNQFLNTALTAAAHKMKMKMEKDKLAAKQRHPQGPNKIVNKTVVIGTSELLAQMRDGNTIIDMENDND